MKSSAEKDCFRLIQEIALAQDPVCLLCPAPSQCGHHLFGRGLAAAFNPEMVRGLCNTHHLYAHARPEGFRECMLGLIGSRYEELEIEASRVVPWIDFVEERARLRGILRELKRRVA